MKKFKGGRKLFRHPFHAMRYGEFTWCLHCQRVYLTESWVKNDWNCPDRECDGGALDACPWCADHWPMSCNPDYPVTPEVGKRYLLYGKNYQDDR